MRIIPFQFHKESYSFLLALPFGVDHQIALFILILLTNDSLKNEILEKAKAKYIKDDDSEIENAPNVALEMENESIEE